MIFASAGKGPPGKSYTVFFTVVEFGLIGEFVRFSPHFCLKNFPSSFCLH